MIFAQLKLNMNNNFYLNTNASDIPMTILGYFLSDINCSANDVTFYYNWASRHVSDIIINNVVQIEKKHNYVYIKDLFPLPEYETEEFKIHEQLFLRLLGDWQEKVCKQKPMEVTVIYDNNEFKIETKN